MLDQQTMWNFSYSEPNLDIQYKTATNSHEDHRTQRLTEEQSTQAQQEPSASTAD